jgi:hypothetical protein
MSGQIRFDAAVLALSAICSAAHASIVVDQFQPITNSGYSASSRFTFQQSVTASVQGKLVGFGLFSNQVGTANVYINFGPAWQSDAHDWVGTFTSTGPGWDLVDVSSSNIMLNPGDQFVIGFNGADVLAVQGTVVAHPADAYLGGGVFAHDSVLGTFIGPTSIIGARLFNKDLAFETYVDVTDPPLLSGTPEPIPFVIWTGLIGLVACHVTTHRQYRRS